MMSEKSNVSKLKKDTQSRSKAIAQAKVDAQIKKKDKYTLRNWSEYNNSLKSRGKISICLSDDVESMWYHEGKKLKGRQKTYSDVCMELCLLIKCMYGLAYRQIEGFLLDLFSLLDTDLSVPSYTQMQRRSSALDVGLRTRASSSSGGCDIVLDSTGLKVYGEGEWKVRKHGAGKRRTWRKLHMASDGLRLEIISCALTDNKTDDAAAGIGLMEESTKAVSVESVSADGAYDATKFRTCLDKEIDQRIPPPTHAVLAKKDKEVLAQRDVAVQRIAEVGRKAWKQETGYHIRSKSEVNMYRYKKIFGGMMYARKALYQKTEALIKCKILNQFVDLGMPKSYKITS